MTENRSQVIAPWVGQILRIDLTTEKIDTISSFPYVFSYLGGRGLAVRLAWDCAQFRSCDHLQPEPTGLAG